MPRPQLLLIRREVASDTLTSSVRKQSGEGEMMVKMGEDMEASRGKQRARSLAMNRGRGAHGVDG